MCVAGLSKAHAVVNVYSWSGSSRFAWSFGYVVLLAVTAYAFGLPDQPRTRRAALATAIGTTATAAGSISVLQLFAGDALLPRFVVLGSAVILVPWYVLCSYLARDACTRATERDRVMVVARARRGRNRSRSSSQRAPERAATIVGAAHDRRRDVDEHASVATAARDDPCARRHRHRARSGGTGRRRHRGAGVDAARRRRADPHACRSSTSSGSASSRSASSSGCHCSSTSASCTRPATHASSASSTSRSATVGLVALALVTPFVLVGDLIANRGPLLFRQPRTGRSGVPFEILKFRTMRRTSDDDASRLDRRRRCARHPLRPLPAAHAPRRAAPGGERAARRAVGRRPAPGAAAVRGASWSTSFPFYRLRHLVRPGLTGWAQVKYPYAGNEAETLEKLQYEFYYLRRQSLGLDLRIVGRTLRTVVGGRGSMSEPDGDRGRSRPATRSATSAPTLESVSRSDLRRHRGGARRRRPVDRPHAVVAQRVSGDA